MRTAATIALPAALVLSAAPALAEAQNDGMRLEYILEPGAESCPNEHTFRHFVAAALDGSDPFDPQAARRLTVQITRKRGRFDGLITLYDAAGQSRGTREHTGVPTCDDLAERLAVSISMIVPPPPPPPSAPAPTQAPPADSPPPAAPPPSPAPRASTTAAPPPQAPRPPPRASEAPPSPKTAGPRPQLGAGLLVPIGAAPGITVGFSASFGFRWPMLSLNLEGRMNLDRSTAEYRGASADVSLFGGSFIPCFHYARIAICGVLAASAVRVVGVDATPIESWGPRVEVGGRLGFEIPLSERLSLLPSGDLLFAARRYGVTIRDYQVWLPSVANVTPALRLIATF